MKPEELLAHTDFLHALAYRLVRDEHQAADIVQETLVKALEKRNEPIRNVRAWLATVLRNLSRFSYRSESHRKQRESAAAIPESVPSNEEVVEEEEIRREVVAAVIDLEERYRSVLLLRFYRNVPQKEAAERLGIPFETFRSRQKRGLELLRRRLDAAFNGNRRKWVVSLAPLATLHLASPSSKGAAAGSSVAVGGAILLRNMKRIVACAIVVAATVFVLINAGNDGPEKTDRVERTAAVESKKTGASEDRSLSAESRPIKVAMSPIGTQADIADEPRERATITGRFIDTEGRPIEGVLVRHAFTRGEPEVRSGANGRFSSDFRISSDEDPVILYVTASKKGYVAHETRIELAPGQEKLLGDITLEPGGDLSVRVKDRDGNFVSGVKVWWGVVDLGGTSDDELRRRGPQNSWSRDKTNANGICVKEGVPVGWVRVWAKADDTFYAWSEPVEIRSDVEAGPVELVIERVSVEDCIRGVVLSPAGDPVPRAKLHLKYKALFSSRMISVRAGEDGRFCAILPRKTSHDIWAADPKNRCSPVRVKQVQPGTENLVIRLKELAVLRMLVRTEGAKPLEALSVDASNSDYLSSAIQRRFDAKEIGPEGLVELTVPSVDLKLSVHSPGFESIETDWIDPTLPLELVFIPIPGVSGRVWVNKTPAAGARVSLHEEKEGNGECRENGFLCRSSSYPSAKTVSNDEGKFHLDLSGSGVFYLRAELEGYSPAEIGPSMLDPNDGGTDLDISITKGGSLEGRVIMPPGRDPAGVIVGVSRGDGFGYTKRTDRDGCYRFEHLTPGRWLVRRCEFEVGKEDRNRSGFFSSGTGTGEREIPWNCVVEDEQTTYFNLDLKLDSRPTVRGMLTLNGSPPKAWNASLLEDCGENRYEETDKADLDAKGVFVLRGKKEGRHRIMIKGGVKEGPDLCVTDVIDLTAGETPWNLNLETERRLLENIPWPEMEGAFLMYEWVGSGDLTSFTQLEPNGADSQTLTVPKGAGHLYEYRPNAGRTSISSIKIVSYGEKESRK